jgi:CRP-like cAMP-binding protein
MFGMYPIFKATYQAKTEVKLLSINKPYIYNELHKYEIVRINFLNLLSNTCQSAHRKLWNSHSGTMEAKIAHFLTNRCLKPQGEKVLHITMEDLGYLIDETRMNVSRLLNELQQNELLQLRRREIYIPSLEKLTAHLL